MLRVETEFYQLFVLREGSHPNTGWREQYDLMFGDKKMAEVEARELIAKDKAVHRVEVIKQGTDAPCSVLER